MCGFHVVIIMINFSKSDAISKKQRKKPRTERPASNNTGWRKFKVGDVIDCEDSVGGFYESTVREVKADEVKVHFNGWADRYDEWISKNSPRLAPKNSRTTAAYSRPIQMNRMYVQMRVFSSILAFYIMFILLCFFDIPYTYTMVFDHSQ